MLQIEINQYLMNPSINVVARQSHCSICSLRFENCHSLFYRLQAESHMLFQRLESSGVLSPDEIEHDSVECWNNFISLRGRV